MTAFSQDLVSMIISLHHFVERYTGDAAVGEDANYLVNKAGVVNNSLHFESGRGNYLPSNAATSESQVLLALGYIRAYEATGIEELKTRAIHYTDAYMAHYFPAYSLPANVGEWRHHWVVNGKYPFKTLSPVDTRDSQRSGSFDLVVSFTDGVGFIPHGSPSFGEQTARVYFAYGPVDTARLVWNNVFASVVGGTGAKYAVDHFIDHRTMKMDAGGTELGLRPGETVGKVKLIEPFTGQLKLAFATQLGPMIARNAGFDAWPMWRKLDVGECASAMDVELWHIELFKAMYENTQNPVYLRAYNSAAYSLDRATQQEPEAYYFRRDFISAKPLNHGVGYWSLNNSAMTATAAVERTGVSVITKSGETGPGPAQIEVAQLGVFNRVSAETILNCELAANSRNAFCILSITTKADLASAPERFGCVMLANDQLTGIANREFKLKSFYRQQRADGSKLFTIDQATIQLRSGAIATNRIGYVGDRTTGFTRFDMPFDEANFTVGFWSVTSDSIGFDTLTYRLNSGRCAVTVQDGDGWIWGKELSGSLGAWSQYTLDPDDFTLWPYQENTGDEPDDFPTGMSLTSFSISAIASDSAPSLDIYCYGERPTAFDQSDAMLTELKVQVTSQNAITLKLGNVYVSNRLPISYRYSPGVVPFTTDRSAQTGMKFWRGTPYVAYQMPSIWAMLGRIDRAEQVIQFYKDSQDDYEDRSGLRGPFTQVYIWPKWDNVDYGLAEGFSATGPDPNTYWGGFQARSFRGAAALLLQMQQDGVAIPADLYAVVDDYAAFLVQFLRDNGNSPPTFFAQDGSAPPTASYEEPHIAALHVSALTCLIQAGHETPDIIEARERSLAYLYALFRNSGDMAGSFSPSPSTRLFYGFWVGEIIRALSESITMEDQLLMASAPDTQGNIEMEFADDVIVILETGQALAYNKIITALPTDALNDMEMEFEGQTTVTLETGADLAFEKAFATSS